MFFNLSHRRWERGIKIKEYISVNSVVLFFSSFPILKRINMKISAVVSTFFIFLLLSGPLPAQNEWAVIVSEQQLNDEAIKVAINDLVNTGNQLGISFQVINRDPASNGNLIIVGNPERNELSGKLYRTGNVEIRKFNNPEGYQIVSKKFADGRKIFVSGGSISGDVYGLYWIWDRLRVHKKMTDINVFREPALPVRYTRVRVNSVEDIQRALRYGLNTVYTGDQLGLGHWGVEPEDSECERNRKKVSELIEYAHRLHLKCLAFGTEFTYLPALLEEFNARLSPCDEKLWDALQEKYRRVLKALPELDGIATFTGPEQSFWGNYKKFDLMHDDENCEWPLDKRYRTFVEKVHEVVVGEFGKIYHHRTWMTNTYEQQARYEVYKKIFTEEVPTGNLYLIPSFTQNDRWWHQRYNPTFNQTPHQMLAVLEPMNYYEASKSNIFPTYPGIYFQAGLESVLEEPNSNLKGLSFDLYAAEDHKTSRLTAYTVFRLGWNYLEDPRQIAEDFCSIYFGPQAAMAMADIYMLSPVVYKYGLFIEPVAYGEFNSLPHIRVGTFPAQGYPAIDNGKEHLDFWRKIYLRCKPWLSETYQDLDHGLTVASQMLEMYRSAKLLIKDPELAGQVENELKMTERFVQTNNLYVKTAFAYFSYRDDPDEKNHELLTDCYGQLQKTVDEFKALPGFGYKLFGVEQLLSNAGQILTDRMKALAQLANAPSSDQIEKTVASLQEKYLKIISDNKNNLVKVLHFEGQIDGRDILRIKGSTYAVEHLRWDPPTVKECKFFNPLPQKEISLVVDVIQARPVSPFILRQPTETNDYTADVYMYDIPEGRDWVKFDLYYIDKSPQESALEVPWQ